MAILLEGEFQAARRAGYTRGAPAKQAVFRGVAVGAEVHIVSGFAGSLLTEVDESSASIGQADEHESTASDVSGIRMRDGQRETHSDRGINRVAAGFQDRDSHLGGKRLLGDDHSFASVDRLVSIGRRHKEGEGECDA